MQIDEERAIFDKCYGEAVKPGIQKQGYSKKYGGLAIRSAIMANTIVEEVAFLRG